MREENKNYGDCIAVIGSVTQAMRAKSVLESRGLRAEVIKVDSTVTGRGCAYGLMYPCGLEKAVLSTLHASGIRVKVKS